MILQQPSANLIRPCGQKEVLSKAGKVQQSVICVESNRKTKSHLLEVFLVTDNKQLLQDPLSVVIYFAHQSISRYTIIFGHVFSADNKTLKESKFLAREKATYSCPWLNTATLRTNPTFSNVSPCALLMVMAKEICTGN